MRQVRVADRPQVVQPETQLRRLTRELRGALPDEAHARVDGRLEGRSYIHRVAG